MNSLTLNRRESIKRACETYARRTMPKIGPSRKNKRPEIIKTVIPCWQWLRQNGFDISIIESKATYSQSQGRYMRSNAEIGYTDISGNSKMGLAVYIECKAPGRRSDLRGGQREFLKRKIHTHCFAVVVDSPQLLESLYVEYRKIRSESFDQAVQFLLDQLPKNRQKDDDSSLF